MKKLFLFLMLACACTTLASAQGWGRRTPADTLRSTVVDGDRVIFQIYAPKARTVSVAGRYKELRRQRLLPPI